MKVYNGLEEFKPLEFAVVTSGTFDGVHIGHRKILERVKKIAKDNNGQSVIITFWPHPRLVLFPDQQDLRLLTTLEEKEELIQELEIDHLLKIPFTREFSELSSQQFIEEVLIKRINTKKLVIGYDHRFGRNREGSFEHLQQNSQKYGFEVEEIPRQEIENVAVSSTKIRKAIVEGKIEEANEYLGREYSFSGIVIKGEMVGRVIGFPTANIEITNPYKLIPADGIYAARVLSKHKNFLGMLYIGNRPTLNGSTRSIEVNIFDFNQNIYGEVLKVSLVKRIRDDAVYSNLEELKIQLAEDKRIALKILESNV